MCFFLILNKRDKEQLVIKMYHEGKTMREIAHSAHMSFTDIKKIIQKIVGLKDENENVDMKNKSKTTQAIYLFSIGKTPIQVGQVVNN